MIKAKMKIEEFRMRYGTEAACLRALLEFRMPKDRRCPNCRALIDETYKKRKDRKCFGCNQCLGQVSPMAGAPLFHKSRIPLEKKFEILYMFLNHSNGTSSGWIHDNFTGSDRTAYKILDQIRTHMGTVVREELERAPFDTVEIDEGYLPTGNKGLPRHYAFKRGRGSEKNSSIIGIVERGGRVVLYVVPKTDSQSIVPVIQSLVPVGSTIYTDSWSAYNPLLSLGYKHEVVNHDIEFVKKSASTNAMENVFSNLGRMIGTYRNVSEYKLQQYLNEFAFRRCFGAEYDRGLERFLRAFPSITECYWDQKTRSAA